MPTSYERALAWHEMRTALVLAAQDAEKFAYSHRQEQSHRHPVAIGRYGTAVLACRPGATHEQRFVIGAGWNFKLRAGSGRLIQYHPVHDYKLCSEPDATIQALSQGCTEVHGFALYSDNMQAEDVSGVFCNIQHPCEACRTFMGLFLIDSSPILLARRRLACDMEGNERSMFMGDLIVETWTYGEICKHHKSRTGPP